MPRIDKVNRVRVPPQPTNSMIHIRTVTARCLKLPILSDYSGLFSHLPLKNIIAL